jgi:hypothetical protein
LATRLGTNDCDVAAGGFIVGEVAASTLLRAASMVRVVAALASFSGCTTIDPGPNFVVAQVTFDANYFYCHVEPQLIFAYNCGPGDPSLGDKANGCHYNPSAVSGMALLQHTVVDCGGGDVPLTTASTGPGSPAESNYEAVSLEMSPDYLTAPVYVRPSGHYHPRQVFSPSDPTVNALLSTWASK